MNNDSGEKLRLDAAQAQELEDTYDGLFIRLKELSEKPDKEVLFKEIAKTVDYLIDILSKQGSSLLLFTGKIFEKDYIFAHSLNVAIISLRMGLRLKFDRLRLKNLGMLALLHSWKDIGFVADNITNINCDEQMKGIARLADVYDGLTCPSSHRQPLTTYETITSIIKLDKSFDRNLVKILLDEMSLFPKGSWVELSNKEIGKVSEVNKEKILRPKIKVFIDKEGKLLSEPRIVDLTANSLIYILRPLTEEEVERLSKGHKKVF